MKLWIQGLDQEKTKIYFHGDPIFSDRLFFVLVLEPFLTYKLSKKGVLMLHSSALAFKNKGVIFSGGTGVGKTTALLSLLNNPSAKYFADDQSIVNGRTLYSYPVPIGLRSHLVYKCGLKLGLRNNATLFLQNIANVLLFYYGNLTHRVRVDELSYRYTNNCIKSGIKSNIEWVFILNLGRKPKLRKLISAEALEHLLYHNRKNEDKQKLLNEYFSTYRQVFPEFDHWKKFVCLLTEFVECGVDFYEIQLSKKYSVKENLEKMVKVMEEKT